MSSRVPLLKHACGVARSLAAAVQCPRDVTRCRVLQGARNSATSARRDASPAPAVSTDQTMLRDDSTSVRAVCRPSAGTGALRCPVFHRSSDVSGYLLGDMQSGMATARHMSTLADMFYSLIQKADGFGMWTFDGCTSHLPFAWQTNSNRQAACTRQLEGVPGELPWEVDDNATHYIQQLLTMKPKHVHYVDVDGVDDHLEVFQLDTLLLRNEKRTSTALVVGSNMRTMWARLLEQSAAAPRGDQRFIIVGSPGLGKSRSILYFIREVILGRRELVKRGVPMPVVVFEHRKDSLTWVFAPVDPNNKDTEYLAWCLPASLWHDDQMPALKNPDNVFVVDTAQAGQLPAPALVAATTILVCGPDPEHYSEFRKDVAPGCLVYAAPACPETVVAAAKYMAPHLQLSEAELRHRIGEVGPIPRRVFADATEYAAYKHLVENAVKAHPQDVERVLGAGLAGLESSTGVLKPLNTLFMIDIEDGSTPIMRFVSNFARSRLGLNLVQVVFTSLLHKRKVDTRMKELWVTMEYLVYRLAHSGAWTPTIKSVSTGEEVDIRIHHGTGPVCVRTPPWAGVYADIKELGVWDGKSGEPLDAPICLGGNFPAVDLMDGRNRGFQVTIADDKGLKPSAVDRLRNNLGLDDNEVLHVIIVHLPNKRPRLRRHVSGVELYTVAIPAPNDKDGEPIWKAALQFPASDDSLD